MDSIPPYSSSNPGTFTLNETWDVIPSAPGTVALDVKQAAEHILRAPMDLPSDPSKGVPVLDAYHQIHCLMGVARYGSATALR